METAQIREELHQFIDRADHRILNLVYGMMKADDEEGYFAPVEPHEKLLDERLGANKSPFEDATKQAAD